MLIHVKRKPKKPAKEWRLSCTKCGHEWTLEVKALTWNDYPEPQLCPLCQGKSIRIHKSDVNVGFGVDPLQVYAEQNTP